MERTPLIKQKSNEKFELKEKLGLWSAVSILCGIMVGAGIFISPVGVFIQMQGSVGLSLVMWVACGIFSGFTALCYAELGCCIQNSGGDFAYHCAAIGPAFGFLFVWSTTVVVRGIALAAMGIIFGTYLTKPFFPHCDPPVLALKLIGICLLLLITWINCKSVKLTAKIEIVFTIAKFLVLLLIIVIGFLSLIRQDPIGKLNFENAFNEKIVASVTAREVGLAFFEGLFCYSGYTNLNYLTEELKNVKRNLPRSINISVLSVSVFYVLVNISYFAVLTPMEMMSTPSVGVTFAEKTLGTFSWVIPIGVCISAMGSMNGAILSIARIYFVAARHGHYPEILSMIHTETFTPNPATIVLCLSGVIFIFPTDISTLLHVYGFTMTLFNGLGALDLVILRYSRPGLHRPYRVPIVVPFFVVITSICLVVVSLLNGNEMEFTYVGIFTVCGLPVYFVFVHKKKSIPGMRRITLFLQKVMNVAPTDWENVKL